MKAILRVLLVCSCAIFFPVLAFAQSEAESTADSVATPVAPAVVDSTPAVSDAVAAQAVPPGNLYYVQGEKLIKVEETPIETGTSVGAGAVAGAMLGFGGGPKSWMVLPGTTSELTIAEPQPRFRLACERSLALSLRLGLFEVKGEKRRSQVDLGKLDVFKKKVPVTATKVSEGVYEFAPVKPLKPGEYAFTAGYGNPVAEFTIVAPSESETGESE